MESLDGRPSGYSPLASCPREVGTHTPLSISHSQSIRRRNIRRRKRTIRHRNHSAQMRSSLTFSLNQPMFPARSGFPACSARCSVLSVRRLHARASPVRLADEPRRGFVLTGCLPNQPALPGLPTGQNRPKVLPNRSTDIFRTIKFASSSHATQPGRAYRNGVASSPASTCPDGVQHPRAFCEPCKPDI